MGGRGRSRWFAYVAAGVGFAPLAVSALIRWGVPLPWKVSRPDTAASAVWAWIEGIGWISGSASFVASILALMISVRSGNRSGASLSGSRAGGGVVGTFSTQIPKPEGPV